MKKYLGIIIALLVGIGVFSIPSEVNAMTQKDLGGKVYLKQSNAPSQGNRHWLSYLIRMRQDAFNLTVR